MTPEVEERIWAEVQRRIDMGPAGRPDLQPVPDRRPLVLSLAVVACAVVVAVLLVSQRSPSNEVATAPTVDPAGRVTLAQLAATARTQPVERVGPGEVFHIVIDYVAAPTQSPEDVEERREEWRITADGQGNTLTSPLTGTPEVTNPDRTTFDQPGALPWAGYTPDQIASLPADPVELLASLRETTESGRRDPPLNIPLELLATPLVPASARHALFEVLGVLGLEVLGPTTDQKGRAGIVVAGFSAGGGRVEAVIDPHTTTLLTLRQEGPGRSAADPALAIYHDIDVRPAN